MSKAREGKITKEIKKVAKDENVSTWDVRDGISKGNIVIPYNRKHKSLEKLVGIGKGLRTKINTNIGTSSETSNLEQELEKLDIAIEAGTDAVMDLSTSNINEVRKAILEKCIVPVGTVPIYQAAMQAARRKGIVCMTSEEIFDVIEEQADEGVDFMTVHAGVTRKNLEKLKKEGRILDIISRGGAFLVTWMIYNKKENPLFENYDKLLKIARKYDITLSLGDGFRPGCLADSTDSVQIQELITLSELAKRAWKENVQVIIEGPGHIPLDEIEENIKLEKEICKGAPFYVLGPLVTDITPGYDHITGAIGGALAGMYGADFLCYLTPSEHLSLPDKEDVRRGVIVTKIAAHVADIAKKIPGAADIDLEMSKARKNLDWQKQIKLAIDSETARHYREKSKIKTDKCTMCGEYCAIALVNKYLKVNKTFSS